VLFKWRRHNLNLLQHGTAGARYGIRELAFKVVLPIYCFVVGLINELNSNICNLIYLPTLEILEILEIQE
jgi:hypothetical protein